MTFKRFFAFGCSFTYWSWPTWADIIAYDLGIPCENWGLAGLGNVGIASKIIECDLSNQYNDDDLILVMWSTWSREDRHYSDERHYGWKALGDVSFSFDRHFIEKYWSISNDLIKNSNAIISTNKMYGDRIKLNGHIFPPLISDDNQLAKLECTELDKTIAKFYKPHIINDGNFNKSFGFDHYPVDGHPSVLSHLQYVQEVIYPKLNLVLKNHTVTTMMNIHNEINEYVSNLPSGANWRPGVSELLRKYNFDIGASNRKIHGL